MGARDLPQSHAGGGRRSDARHSADVAPTHSSGALRGWFDIVATEQRILAIWRLSDLGKLTSLLNKDAQAAQEAAARAERRGRSIQIKPIDLTGLSNPKPIRAVV